MRFLIALDIDDSLPIERQRQVALGAAFELNVLNRNPKGAKVDIDYSPDDETPSLKKFLVGDGKDVSG